MSIEWLIAESNTVFFENKRQHFKRQRYPLGRDTEYDNRGSLGTAISICKGLAIPLRPCAESGVRFKGEKAHPPPLLVGTGLQHIPLHSPSDILYHRRSIFLFGNRQRRRRLARLSSIDTSWPVNPQADTQQIVVDP
ncbi:hypothetical protein NJC40_27995 [Pseudomonas sp. 21LCFQ02]|uniref:hypothetical protein n=1 Tax=Pseudomonas sp. 21LCFQ02 TaxID=2957505 RepID=UPI00209B6BD9|nr:hypothetical protein [Pseudomonas sp. 21LCFQ02]MCO8171613.1 hypothetical protein [Pseudomonas sp. 21LCFQ02]